jgi:enoyl-[acyl-carrier protein] reductase II
MAANSGGPAPNRVCELAKIDVPIIQAPMTYIAGAQLAAAVSNAGALGIIETTSDQGRSSLRAGSATPDPWPPQWSSAPTTCRWAPG